MNHHTWNWKGNLGQWVCPTCKLVRRLDHGRRGGIIYSYFRNGGYVSSTPPSKTPACGAKLRIVSSQ